MACYQPASLPSGVSTSGRTSYATQAECLEACKEGACCEGTTCTVKPQCQCQGAGKTFKGVGTTCANNICETCRACGDGVLPNTVTLVVSNFRNGPNALSPSRMSTISAAIVGTHTLSRSLPDVAGNAVYTAGVYNTVSSIGFQRWIYYPCDTGRHKTTGNSPLAIIYGEGGGAGDLRFGSGQLDLKFVDGSPVQFTSGSMCDGSSTSRVGQVTSPQANTGVLVAYFDWTATPNTNPLP